MERAKSSYTVNVRGRELKVTSNALQHLLPQSEELHQIVGGSFQAEGRKSGPRVSAEVARNVLRDFLLMVIEDLIEKKITFIFPVPGVSLRIEDAPPADEVRREDLKYVYNEGKRSRVRKARYTPYNYRPVLRFSRGFGLHSGQFTFILTKDLRRRLFAKVKAGTHYFHGKKES